MVYLYRLCLPRGLIALLSQSYFYFFPTSIFNAYLKIFRILDSFACMYICVYVFIPYLGSFLFLFLKRKINMWTYKLNKWIALLPLIFIYFCRFLSLLVLWRSIVSKYVICTFHCPYINIFLFIMHSIKSGCCWSGAGRGWRWHGWRNIYRLCELLMVSFWKHSLLELCLYWLLFQLLFHVMLAHFSGIKMSSCAAATKSIYWTSTPRSCCGDFFLVCSAATRANLWSKT